MLIRARRVRFSTSLSNHLANIQLQKTGQRFWLMQKRLSASDLDANPYHIFEACT